MAVTVAPNPGMLRFPYKKAPAGGGHAEEKSDSGEIPRTAQWPSPGETSPSRKIKYPRNDGFYKGLP